MCVEIIPSPQLGKGLSAILLQNTKQLDNRREHKVELSQSIMLMDKKGQQIEEQ